MQRQQLPPELESVREAAGRAISPVKPVDGTTLGTETLFYAKRTGAGWNLPEYYLVYFLLVDLLGFEYHGQFEKVAWSVPIDFNGRAFVVEHRKMGLGIFVEDLERDEAAAREIVVRIHKAVKVARPFFDWLATEAVNRSAVNVVNNSSVLYGRYVFLLDAYRAKLDEAIRLKDERVVEKGETSGGGTWQSVSFPAFQMRREADWIALSVVESFFAWTEHVFIHLAILSGRISTAKDVTAAAEADWAAKFKIALDITDPSSKRLFDRLLSLRREIRNYVAHGAFGKEGEAFAFHSGAGAVPVLLPHKTGSRRFTLGSGLAFNAGAAMELLEEFREHLWAGARSPAEIYIQQSDLPIVLTMATDGTYVNAMRSNEDMQDFVEQMNHAADDAANMDW